MSTGRRYEVIHRPALESGIEAERREIVIPNRNWVIDEVVMTGCGSQPVIPRVFAPQPSYRHIVTTVSQDIVLVGILGISFLTISEEGVQFRVLVENVIYHSSHPFFLIVERVVQLPKEDMGPYARRHFILPRQIRNGELGEYPECGEFRSVKQEPIGRSESYEWVCLSELARATAINPGMLAEDYLWPPFLEAPRGQSPFVVAESAVKVAVGKFTETVLTLDPKRSLMKFLPGCNWANMVWVALPIARAIMHLKGLHFEVGDRSEEVPLRLSWDRMDRIR